MPTSIATENARTGTARTLWDLPDGQFGGCPDLQGFVDGLTVDRSEVVQFKIGQTGPDLSWLVQIFRLGWYGGAGARLIATLAPSRAQMAIARRQPLPVTCDPSTDLQSADCSGWRCVMSWVVPSDVPGGVFLARLNRQDGQASHVQFVVREDDRRPDIRVQLADPTWHAYNAFGGLGGALYTGNSLYYGTDVDQYTNSCARVVSYDRPIINRGAVDRQYGAVKWSTFFTTEYPVIRWLERNGYDVAYMGGIDAMGGRNPDAEVAMMIGHNEYWSQDMKDAWIDHLRAGGHMIVCASNEAFWRTLGEKPDSTGRPRRIRCHKDILPGRTTPIAGWTGTWRAAGQPENAWTGTVFGLNGPDLHALTVPARLAGHPLWRDTEVATLTGGQVWTSGPDVIGFESDVAGPADTSSAGAGHYMEVPGPAVQYLSDTPITSDGNVLLDSGQAYGAGTVHHHLVAVARDSGGLTLATGTMNFAWTLDDGHLANGVGQDNTSDVLRQLLVNGLADMGVQPATLMDGLTVATAHRW